MNDIAQDRLHDIIKTNGVDLIKHPDRCEGLLRDHCAEYRLEISVLVSALKERIPNELLKPVSGVPRDVQLGMLARRLEENNGFTESAAVWAVDAWAVALDQPPSSKKKSAQNVVPAPVPTPTPAPFSEPTPVSTTAASSSAWSGPLVALVLLAGIAFAGYQAWAKFGPHDTTPVVDGGTTGPVGADAKDGGKDAKGGAGATDKKTAKADGDTLAHGAVTVPSGTPLNVRMTDGVSSENASVGETLLAVLDKPVTLKGDDAIVLPKGTAVTVRVTSVAKVGRVKGAAELGLRVVSVSLHDQTIPVSTGTWLVKAKGRGKSTGKMAGIVGAIGAGIGAITGGAKGAVAGAMIGAGGAVAYQEVKPGEPIDVRPEAVLRFNTNEALDLHL